MMLNFAKFSSGLTVVAATGFLIGAMLTDNGGQPSTSEVALNNGAAIPSARPSKVPEPTQIDNIITSNIERVKRSESDALSVTDLLIMERINTATHAGAKKTKKVASIETSGSLVKVQPGDTLYGIGLKHGLTISEIASLNGLSDPYTVRVGQKLRVN